MEKQRKNFFFPKTNCFYSLRSLKTTVGLSEKKVRPLAFPCLAKICQPTGTHILILYSMKDKSIGAHFLLELYIGNLAQFF